MSEHGLFFNSLDHDRVYDAESFSDWLKKFFTNGVFTGDLFVQADEGMNIKVGTGYCNINGKVMIYAEPTPLVVEPANGIYPRIDTVVLELNMTERDIFLKVVTGDYAGLTTPQPTPPVRTGAIYQLVLAQIYVGVGVTEITQADITDTRPITELCGIVTGTVTEMDFSQFAAQFATYYAQFKAGYESDMEAWKALQEQSFEAWEIAEKADFDEWFANLHYILDGDVAGHLQNEIDALAAGATGSIFRIHTTESSLIGKSVTLTGSTETETEVFDSNGNAEFKGITDIGVITFVSTDGTDTARTQITIPYFGNYPINMAFWSATVNIHTDTTDLYGATISVIKNNVLIDTTTFDNTGEAVYTATSTGTYRFRVTLSGQDYEVEQAVTEQTTYNLTLNAGLDLQAWITAGSTTDYPLSPSSYTDFASLEADEEAIRQLMLVHNAVDYLATAGADDALIEDVINSDICAKWINLSDYALDTLYANSDIADVMDTADKYFYGEWGLVGQVPNLTSDTGSNGTTFASSVAGSSYPAWKAFTGKLQSGNSNAWCANELGSIQHDEYVGYYFNAPVCVKKIDISFLYYGNMSVTFLVEGSNTGNNDDYTPISNSITINSDVGTQTYYMTNNNAYSYYRVRLTSQTFSTSDAWCGRIDFLQFYAYEPLGNVPIMTANNAPYGTVIYSGIRSGEAGAYTIFDGNDSAGTETTLNSLPAYLGYTSVNPIKVKRFHIIIRSNGANRYGKTYKIQGSNDGFVNDVHDLFSETIATGSTNYDEYKDIPENAQGYYTSHRIYCTESYTGNLGVYTLQFYGRELKPLVPTMTGNDTPKGEAFADSYERAERQAVKAFDNDKSTLWGNSPLITDGECYIGYEFDDITVVRGFYIYMAANVSNLSYKLQGWNDTAWETIASYNEALSIINNRVNIIKTENNTTPYTKVKILMENQPTHADASYYTQLYTLQFFGFDYSEKEFAQGSTRKTIYDHGLSFVTFDEYLDSGSITYEPNQIYVENTATNHSTKITTLVDYGTNKYAMQGMIVGNKMVSPYNANGVYNAAMSSAIATSVLVDKYNALDVSSVSGQNRATGVTYYGGAGKFSIAEWWLE